MRRFRVRGGNGLLARIRGGDYGPDTGRGLQAKIVGQDSVGHYKGGYPEGIQGEANGHPIACKWGHDDRL